MQHRKGKSRYLSKLVGVGGLKCPCCAPPRGKTKGLFRQLRRKMKLDAFKIEEKSN